MGISTTLVHLNSMNFVGISWSFAHLDIRQGPCHTKNTTVMLIHFGGGTVLENQKSLENTAFLSFGTNATFVSNECVLFEKPQILGKYSILRKRSLLSNERILFEKPKILGKYRISRKRNLCRTNASLKKNQKTLENTAFLSFWHERGFFCRTITTVLENQKSVENTAFLSFGTNATFLSNERILFEKPKILGKYSISRKRSICRTNASYSKNQKSLENTAFRENHLCRTNASHKKTKKPGKIQHF